MGRPVSVDWGAAGVALTAFLAWTGMTGWVWSVRSIAINARDDLADLKAERARDKIAYDARLQKAEAVAASVERLADAVKAGSELTALQMANLAEKVSEHATFAKEQFAEIRHEQKNVRTALAGQRARRT